MIESRVEIETADGTMPTFVFHPEDGGPYPVVFYLMDAPSIRPALMEMASRLATTGYYVMMPYLYYRHSEFRQFGSTDEELHLRRELMQSVTVKTILPDAEAMLGYADSQQMASSSKKIGAVGFCMSGPLVLSLAQNMPEKVGAVASIHGAWLVNDTEDSPHRNLDRIKAEVYFGWADNDPTATKEEKQIMEDALISNSVDYTLDFFEDAVHGYAPAGERHHHAASERHWECVHRMFTTHLT